MHIAKPTPQQLQWQDMELGVIIHYVLSAYKPGCHYKSALIRDEIPLNTVKPTKLYPEQWVKCAWKMGAKYAVFVANHCEGFSLWPTKVNDFSIASIDWKDGKADLVREFIDACKKYGLKPGIYYSTGCNGYYDVDGEPEDYKSKKYQEYVQNVEAQVKELWTEYGELFEIWFDGGIVPPELGGPDLAPMLKKYQPNAICFQGPKSFANNVRWVGNEDGLAPENCWATTNAGDASYTGTVVSEEAGIGDPNGIYYWPAETDMPNRKHMACGCGWGWAEGEGHMIYSPDELLDCYIRSVGRNSNLLLGMAISTDGDFQDEEQFRQFGQKIRETFGTPIAIKFEPKAKNGEITLPLPENTSFDYLVIREDIREGQRIRAFDILVDGSTVYSSNCIGHKRIIPMKGTKASNVTLKVTAGAYDWAIRDIAIY